MAATPDVVALVTRLRTMVTMSRLPLPTVRRLALAETLRHLRTEEEIASVFMDAVQGSPYVDEERKAVLANLVLDRNWSVLASLEECQPRPGFHHRHDIDNEFYGLRVMASLVFSRSRKLQGLTPEQRQELGMAIAHCQTREQLMDLMLTTFAATPQGVLDEATRTRIVEDTMAQMYHRLLLPDWFDCDERPRLGAEDVSMECPVCLESASATVGLSNCTHRFCRPCITRWAKGSLSVGCPMCRAMGTIS